MKLLHEETFAANPEAESDLPLLVLDVRDGVSYPPRVGHNEMHWHEDVQFIIFVEGEARIDTPDTHFTCRAGEAALFTPDALHRVTSTIDSLYTSFVFPQSALQLIPGSNFSAKTVTARCAPNVQQVYHFDGSEPWHAEIVENLLKVREVALAKPRTPIMSYRALAYLCAAWSCFSSNVEFARQSTSDLRAVDRLRDALSFMKRHMADQVTAEDIACAVSASESSLLRVFKGALSTTPIAYLQDMRLNAATQMLNDPLVSMAAVATSCGFADSSHMSHVFKRRLGMTPSEYRDALMESAC